MFENEILRLVEMRLHARGDRPLLARIDRALYILNRGASAANDDADYEALEIEIEALMAIARRGGR